MIRSLFARVPGQGFFTTKVLKMAPSNGGVAEGVEKQFNDKKRSPDDDKWGKYHDKQGSASYRRHKSMQHHHDSGDGSLGNDHYHLRTRNANLGHSRRQTKGLHARYGQDSAEKEGLKTKEDHCELDESFWKNSLKDLKIEDSECAEIATLKVPGCQKDMALPKSYRKFFEEYLERLQSAVKGGLAESEAGHEKTSTEEQSEAISDVSVTSRQAVSYYSRDEGLNLMFQSDASSRFYNRPRRFRYPTDGKFIYDLFEGWQDYKPYVYDRAIPRLSGSLGALQELETEMFNKYLEKPAEGSPYVELDFISNKGPLVRLMQLSSSFIVQSSRVDIELNISTIGSQILVSNNLYRELESAKDLQNGYLGHKFEQIVTTSQHPSDIDDWKKVARERHSQPLTNHASFKLLMKVVLDKQTLSQPISVVMSSESDCRLLNAPVTDLTNHCELKTHVWNKDLKLDLRFQKKLFVTYLQANLTGCGTAVIGFRLYNGKLHHVKEYKVSDLPNHFDPNNFNIQKAYLWLHQVLSWIKAKVTAQGNENAAWRLTYNNQSKCLELRKVQNTDQVETIKRYIYPKSFEDHRNHITELLKAKSL